MLKKRLVILSIVSMIFIFSCKSNNINTKKYIVTSPEIAELIYLIGAQNDVVAVTKECDYPAYYQNLPIVGNFGSVDIEKIVSIHPSIVFTTKLEQNKLNSELTKLNIKTIAIYPKTVDDMLEAIMKIGESTNKNNRAKFVVDSLKTEFLTLKNISKEKKYHPKVFIEIYNSPLMTASNESFVGKLLDYAGGENIFIKLPRDYCRISPEKVLKNNPDIIISLVPGVTKKNIASRKGWQNLNAVRNNRIYTTEDIDPDILLRAGSRVINGIKDLQKIIYEK